MVTLKKNFLVLEKKTWLYSGQKITINPEGLDVDPAAIERSKGWSDIEEIQDTSSKQAYF